MIDLDSLRARLDSPRKAEIRAMISVTPESQRLLHASVTIGDAGKTTSREWQYDQFAFIAESLQARRIAAMLKAETTTIKIGSTVIAVELQNTTFTWQRKPSLAQYDRTSLAWPSVVYQPRLVGPQSTNFGGYLVGKGDTPSFPVLGAAFNAFMFDDFSLTGVSNPSLGEVTVRLVDQRARIHRVQIRPTSLDVWVSGQEVRGTYLELNSIDDHRVIELARSGKVSFTLPTGLSRDAWIWLKSGNDWLDYRPLNDWGGHQSPDVEEELPDDPGAALSGILAQGEGLHIEYKGKLPDTRDEKRHVIKTVVAFANGAGGTIVFGIKDDGDVCGLAGNPQESRSRLTDLLRDLVIPSPNVEIRTRRHESFNVLLLSVAPNDGTVYALAINPNKPEYYVRRDATTFYAQPDEISSIAARAATQQPQPGWLYGG